MPRSSPLTRMSVGAPALLWAIVAVVRLASQDAPTFRAGVDVVQLDVSVLDRDRRPVRGLTAADFTVLEDGKPREIVALRILARARPDVIVAPHPLLDTHPDHQYTTLALAEALRDHATADVTLLLYTNHADGNRYPFGPAGTLVSLPAPPGACSVVIDGIYSHPLSLELQRRKLFAIESMHDIRLSPARQYQVAIGDDRTEHPEARDPDPYITYLRRGPRSNELFYVYDRATFQLVLDAFMDARALTT